MPHTGLQRSRRTSFADYALGDDPFQAYAFLLISDLAALSGYSAEANSRQSTGCTPMGSGMVLVDLVQAPFATFFVEPVKTCVVSRTRKLLPILIPAWRKWIGFGCL